MMRLAAQTVMLVVAFSVPLCSPAAQPVPHSVLLLDQYAGSLPWVGARNAAFRTRLNEGRIAPPVSIYEEYLDFNRFAAPTYKESLKLHFREKYRDKHISLIVAFGPLALDYAVDLRADLWPPTPIVFGEVSEGAISRSSLPAGVTGTTINITFRELVAAARALVPNLKGVALVGDSLENLPAYRHFKDEIPQVTRNLEFIDLTGLTMAELRGRVAGLPDNTVIVYTTINLDRAGVSYVPAEAVSLVAEVANQPMVISTETFLGRGAVGGFILTSATVGQDAARLAARVLGGEDASAIAAAVNAFNKPIFDWRQLKRWHISESSLPAGSEIRFRELTVWERYFWQIVLIVAVILLQSAFIAGLVYEDRRRRSAEASARTLTSELDHMSRVAIAGQLTASIAHEIRQPLTAMVASGSAGLNWLKRKTPDLGKVEGSLQRIVSDGHRASQVITNIQAMFKKEATTRIRLDLNACTQQVLALTKRDIDASRIVLQTDFADDPPPLVLGDPVQLQQVILNLVKNAIEAMNASTHATRMLHLKTEVAPTGTVLIKISDSGPGIDPKVARTVFQPFVTTKSSGMGMGLSICKSIVESHGGQLTVTPGEPRGTVFQIGLPHCRQDR